MSKKPQPASTLQTLGSLLRLPLAIFELCHALIELKRALDLAVQRAFELRDLTEHVCTTHIKNQELIREERQGLKADVEEFRELSADTSEMLRLLRERTGRMDKRQRRERFGTSGMDMVCCGRS